MKSPTKWLPIVLIVLLIALVSALAIVNLKLAAKLEEKADIAPQQKASAPRAISHKVSTPTPKVSTPTPLVNMSTDELDRFLPASVADAVFLKREDIRNPVTNLMTLRRMYGLPGQYGSYVEIHVDRGCTYSTEEETTREKFEEIVAQTNNLESLNQYTDGYFVKRYNNYPAVVCVHQGGRGRTAFLDYSWFRFSVICSNRYNSMYYIDTGIQLLLNNLNLAD